MIADSILNNDAATMTLLIVGCLGVLALIMIPKAMRHRKQVKQNESKLSASEEVIPSENMGNQFFDYRKTFLTTPKIEDGKPVFISRRTRERLDKIARRLGDRRMSASGFIENMAKHHLDEYQDEINRLYKE